jgi:MraZ protein
MLIGEYQHAVDDKKRLSLPMKFRKELGKRLVITRGLEGCLFVYSQKEWEKISGRLAELGMGQSATRGFTRFMLSGAIDVDVDGAGRVLIPEYLKEFARLAGTVIVTGMHSRVEVWNEKAWRDYKRKIEKEADMLAENLGSIGAI